MALHCSLCFGSVNVSHFYCRTFSSRQTALKSALTGNPPSLSNIRWQCHCHLTASRCILLAPYCRETESCKNSSIQAKFLLASILVTASWVLQDLSLSVIVSQFLLQVRPANQSCQSCLVTRLLYLPGAHSLSVKSNFRARSSHWGMSKEQTKHEYNFGVDNFVSGCEKSHA